MKAKHQLPEILAASVVAKSRLFQIESLELKFSNGVERTYERMKPSGRNAVMIVPVTDKGDLLLVREYAAGTERYELGFPKGLIDPGETALEAANRELKEEIGFGARQLMPLKEVVLAPSYFSSKMTLMLRATCIQRSSRAMNLSHWNWYAGPSHRRKNCYRTSILGKLAVLLRCYWRSNSLTVSKIITGC